MKNLTHKQEKVLRFIERYWSDYSLAPSYREIMAHFGFASPHAARRHITALLKKGFLAVLKDKHGRSRSLMSQRALAGVPLVGAIAAGRPIEAVENIQATLDLSTWGINNADKEYFALTVKGDSMINEHIKNGDIVIIKKQVTVSNSDIAAVLWNNEATLKFVKKTTRGYQLVPANDAMQPINVEAAQTQSFEVLGKVVQVVRTRV
ncbi:MAG: transcriptional repressor LexA [Chitinivibrionales bacterium]|nr:transcriptional repressor LexA [Chitinivibrionales bacterium]